MVWRENKENQCDNKVRVGFKCLNVLLFLAQNPQGIILGWVCETEMHVVFSFLELEQVPSEPASVSTPPSLRYLPIFMEINQSQARL